MTIKGLIVIKNRRIPGFPWTVLNQEGCVLLRSKMFTIARWYIDAIRA